MRAELVDEYVAPKNPIRGTFAGCWAQVTVPTHYAMRRQLFPSIFRFSYPSAKLRPCPEFHPKGQVLDFRLAALRGEEFDAEIFLFISL